MKKILIGLIYVLSAFSFLCYPYGKLPSEESASKQSEISEDNLKEIKQENPRLANFEENLLDIQQAIQAVIVKYQKELLSEDGAKEQLRPLLRKKIEIENNPDYLLEKQLYMMLKK